MTRYRIKNWDKYQHYRDRNPPWIKLHYEMLSSEDWVTLDDASRVLAIALMLLASRNDGYIPDDLGFVRRVAYLNSKPDLNPLIKIKFLEPQADASTMLADARPETETETETEVELYAHSPKLALPDLFPEFWSLYPRKVGKAQAEKAYHNAIKKGEISHAALINAVTKLAAAHAAAQTEEQFIPHAGTWLSKKRWTDDLSGLYRRTKGTNTAPNARGSQFSATKSAAAKLIQGLGGLPGAVGGPDSVSTWPDGSQDALPAPTEWPDSDGVQAYSDPGDPASGQTIDHCDVSPADGGEAFLRCQ